MSITKFKDFRRKEFLKENEIKYQALENMKNIQAQLGAVSFIDVIQVMREDNPLKAEIFEMEDKLHELTVIVSEFINDNLPDAVTDTEDDNKNAVDKAVNKAEIEKEIEKETQDEE